MGGAASTVSHVVQRERKTRILLVKYGDPNGKVQQEFDTLGLDRETRLRWLQLWEDMDNDGSNLLDFDEFVEFCGLEKNIWAKRMFSLLDQNFIGCVDFLTFFRALARLLVIDRFNALEVAFRIISRRGSTYAPGAVLDEHDITHFVKERYPNLSRSAVNRRGLAILAMLDEDGTSGVTFEEFQRFSNTNMVFVTVSHVMVKRMREAIFGLGFWKNLTHQAWGLDKLTREKIFCKWQEGGEGKNMMKYAAGVTGISGVAAEVLVEGLQRTKSVVSRRVQAGETRIRRTAEKEMRAIRTAASKSQLMHRLGQSRRLVDAKHWELSGAKIKDNIQQTVKRAKTGVSLSGFNPVIRRATQAVGATLDYGAGAAANAGRVACSTIVSSTGHFQHVVEEAMTDRNLRDNVRVDKRFPEENEKEKQGGRSLGFPAAGRDSEVSLPRNKNAVNSAKIGEVLRLRLHNARRANLQGGPLNSGKKMWECPNDGATQHKDEGQDSGGRKANGKPEAGLKSPNGDSGVLEVKKRVTIMGGGLKGLAQGIIASQILEMIVAQANKGRDTVHDLGKSVRRTGGTIQATGRKSLHHVKGQGNVPGTRGDMKRPARLLAGVHHLKHRIMGESRGDSEERIDTFMGVIKGHGSRGSQDKKGPTMSASASMLGRSTTGEEDLGKSEKGHEGMHDELIFLREKDGGLEVADDQRVGIELDASSKFGMRGAIHQGLEQPVQIQGAQLDCGSDDGEKPGQGDEEDKRGDNDIFFELLDRATELLERRADCGYDFFVDFPELSSSSALHSPNKLREREAEQRLHAARQTAKVYMYLISVLQECDFGLAKMEAAFKRWKLISCMAATTTENNIPSSLLWAVDGCIDKEPTTMGIDCSAVSRRAHLSVLDVLDAHGHSGSIDVHALIMTKDKNDRPLDVEVCHAYTADMIERLESRQSRNNVPMIPLC